MLPASHDEVLTVLVPVLNEGATLRTAIETLLAIRLPIPREVIVIDDGSDDSGTELISDIVDGSTVRLIRHECNMGKGAAIRSGIAEARGTILTIVDADLELDPNDLNKLLEVILSQKGRVAYGKRSFGGETSYSWWFGLGNRFLAVFTSFLFNARIADIETCFKMAETDIWKSLDLKSDRFGVEAEVTGKLLKAGHYICEVPIDYSPRTKKEGKKIKWTDGLSAIAILIGIRLAHRSSKDQKTPEKSTSRSR